MKTIRYVAFLRGVNVGGKMVKMTELKEMLEELGFQNVKTLLNSGNAVFIANEQDKTVLRELIEKRLEKTFSFPINTILRTAAELQKLIDLDPFKGIQVTPETRLYVTFLSEKPKETLKNLYLEKDFKILAISDTEVLSVLTLLPNNGTTDAMKIIEKEFGKRVTTRNWNTVKKVVLI